MVLSTGFLDSLFSTSRMGFVEEISVDRKENTDPNTIVLSQEFETLTILNIQTDSNHILCMTYLWH